MTPWCLLPALLAAALPVAAAPTAAAIDWQRVGAFEIARSETTIAQFRAFAQATRTVTAAEQRGGGEVYEMGWTKKPGWTWQRPFGPGHVPADDEPAVHVTWHEAQTFCRWAGGRLPTDAEWASAAYTEQRAQPPAPFQRGRSYPLPTGDSARGAQCLGDCGPEAAARAAPHGAALPPGPGPARAAPPPPAVTGLFEMGGNAWEWVDDPVGARGDAERRTRGGSWWYGTAQMQAGHHQAKPADTAVVYIGFRCARGG